MTQEVATGGSSKSKPLKESVSLLAHPPDHLLVLRLKKDETIEEIYNGPGGIAWQRVGKLQKTGQRHIQVTTLRGLMDDIPDYERLPRR
jgi:hypothetical protein